MKKFKKLLDILKIPCYYIPVLEGKQRTSEKKHRNARVAQLVERDLAKVEAAGSSPVSRFFHALKSVEIRFQGIFFVPEKVVCRILYGNHAELLFFKKKGL